MMKRNSIEIKVWMRREKITQAHIRRALGFKDPKTVWATLEGRESNRKVLSWLVASGCPKKLLNLPSDMRKAA